MVLLNPKEKEMVLPSVSEPLHKTGFNRFVELLTPELSVKNRTLPPEQGCAKQYCAVGVAAGKVLGPYTFV